MIEKLIHRTTDDTTLRGTDKVKDQLTLIAIWDFLLNHLEGFRVI